MRKIFSLIMILCGVVLLSTSVFASTYTSSAENATQWLSQQQNIDGSWGSDEEVKSLYTSESVGALRSLYEMVPEYYSGLAWIENHDSANLDYRARRVIALAPHGDYLQTDLDYIVNSENSEGWGLESVYHGDPLDTALILQAFEQAGYSFAGTSNTLQQLQLAQLTAADCSVVGADCGWALHDEVSSDVITTAQVVKTLKLYEAAHSGLDLMTDINNAVLSISNQIDITSSALEKAHTALALLKVDPNSTKAAALIDSLVNTDQLLNGSWDNNEYVTAVALKALAAFTGLDDPTKHVACTIPDPQLRAAINVALGKNYADSVTIGEMESLTSLDASGYGISDLTGLETAVNLATADFQNNDITSLTPFTGLLNLTTLLLTGNPLSTVEDIDGDGLSDSVEVIIGSNPLSADPDTDGDGLADVLEQYASSCTDYTMPDSDGDGLLDGVEDANHNGVHDAGETSPCASDTDGDGASDYLEITLGSDPLDNTQAAFELQLAAGWNIISLPLEPADPAIETVLSPLVGTLFTVRTTVDDETLIYNSTGCSNLTEMHAGIAYEVYVSDPANISIPLVGAVSGINFPAMQQGWNFVGSTTLTSLNVTDVALAEELIAVRTTAAGSPTLGAENTLEYPTDFTTLEPGKGYWIYYFPQVSGGAQTPWQTNATGSLATDISWNYTMGYRFTPQSGGNITELGGFFNGTKTVYLWDSSQTLLATASVTAANNWGYSAIAPVYLNAGETYTVAVSLAGSGGSYRYSITPYFPQTYGDIKIEYSTYSYGSGVYPTSTVTSTMYGQADFKFTPEAPTSVEIPQLTWEVPPVNPLQTERTGTVSENIGWNYTMGYRFTPLEDGQVTELGGYFNGTKTVQLWDSSQNVLATASVTAANNWGYTAITPVNVTAGQQYTVAVMLNGSGGTYGSFSMPVTSGKIRIDMSCYASGSAYPIYNVTSYMYGQADIKFVANNTCYTDPLAGDSDSDGLSDSDEILIYGTNPTLADSDSDGLIDGDEVSIYGTNPALSDTDSDGLSDGNEINLYGTSPLIYTYTLTSMEENSGGIITPSGVQRIDQGQSITFTVSPDSSYLIDDVTVDGVSQGAIISYTFSSIVADHTILVGFRPTLTGKLAGDECSSIGIRADGLAEYTDSTEESAVLYWQNIVQVDSNTSGAGYVGVRSDGTVAIAGGFTLGVRNEVQMWQSIIQVTVVGGNGVAGLKSDGTVVTAGLSLPEVSTWNGLTQIDGSDDRSSLVGLKSDGTLVYSGSIPGDITSWTDIVEVSFGYEVVGLKGDGTVLSTNSGFFSHDVSQWVGVKQVSSGPEHIAGLLSDGTVVATGRNYDGQLNVSGWTNISHVNVGFSNTLGLRSDGTVVAAGADWCGKSQVSGWKLSPTISSINDQILSWSPSTGVINFTVADFETEASLLTVTATSSDQSVVEDSDIFLGGSGANRTIEAYTSVIGGTTVITVTVSDRDQNTVSESFIVNAAD